MFDEIPRPSKAGSARKQAWLWIGSAVIGLLLGASEITRHGDIWWLMVAAWTFVLAMSVRRLVASYRDDAQEKQIEKLNG
jgi:hypothetical protein